MGCTCSDCAPEMYFSLPINVFSATGAVMIAGALLFTAVAQLPWLFLAALLFLLALCLTLTPRVSPYDVTWREYLISPLWGAAFLFMGTLLSFMFPHYAVFFIFLIPLIMILVLLSFFSVQSSRMRADTLTRVTISEILDERWFASDAARFVSPPPVGTVVENYASYRRKREDWFTLKGVANSRKVLYVSLGFSYEEIASGQFASYTPEELAVYQALRGVSRDSFPVTL